MLIAYPIYFRDRYHGVPCLLSASKPSCG